jgi:outer membrane protein assembly factor BamE (lipoprotein component of BamABCDE complex)
MNTDTPSALRRGASMRGGPNIPSSFNTSSSAQRHAGRVALRVVGSCLAVSALLAIAACGSNDPNRSGLLEPYRIDLPQGNYITREQVERVREGMTRDQVRFALGTPLLGHVFHTDRWDYVFRFMHPSGQTEQRKVTIRFENDVVSAIEADPLPLREDASDPALPGYRPGAAKQEES